MGVHSAETIGDTELDRLMTEYSNAIFDCGEWDEENDVAETYEACLARATERRVEFVTALRARLSLG